MKQKNKAMKKVIIILVVFLQSCVSQYTIDSIKVGQMYEYGENPFERDTLRIISIKENYAQYYSFKKDTTATEKLAFIAMAIENGDCILITQKYGRGKTKKKMKRK